MTPEIKALIELRERLTLKRDKGVDLGQDVILYHTQLSTILAAIDQLAGGRVAVVPVEPTQAMKEAGRFQIPIPPLGPVPNVVEIYAAMLKAAP